MDACQIQSTYNAASVPYEDSYEQPFSLRHFERLDIFGDLIHLGLDKHLDHGEVHLYDP